MTLNNKQREEFSKLEYLHSQELQEKKKIGIRGIAYYIIVEVTVYLVFRYTIYDLFAGIDFIFYSMVVLVLLALLIFEIKDLLSPPQKFLCSFSVLLSVLAPIVFFGFSGNLNSFNTSQEDIFLIKSSIIVLIFSCGFFHIINMLHKDYQENIELEIGNFRATILISIFFSLSTVFLAFASFNALHNYLAPVRPVTFTLSKQSAYGNEYDEWKSSLGTIQCEASHLSSGTNFNLKVSYLMGTYRFDLADICLAVERNDKQFIDQKD